MAMINNVTLTTGENKDKTSVDLDIRLNTDGTISIKSNGTSGNHTTQIYTFTKDQFKELVKIINEQNNI